MINYYDYIRSEEWRDKAEAAKARAGYRCQVCNTPDSMAGLEAHHRTYERLGNELPEDITVLCGDCHSIFESQRSGRNYVPRGNKKSRVFIAPAWPFKRK